MQWQQVEDGRANVVGTWAGAGGGPTLMFNGHLDTSYSGREPWLQGIPGFQPEGFERDGRIYGLGISNMKGALACYVEAVRSLIEDGVRLKGDVLIAAVAGEIEKTQQGDAQGAEFRGYAAGSRYLVGHGGAADMCILGEPTENKLVLAHFGSLWLRLSTHGPFVHTAFSEGRRGENSIVKMHPVLTAVLEWLPSWEEEMSYGDVRGVANVGSIEGGFGWRASRTPHRTDLFLDLRVPPTCAMAEARRKALEFARSLDGVEAEVYVTAPGAEIDEGHPLVAALEEAHAEVFGARAGAGRDALVLGRLRADAVRHRDGQLRDVERPSRRGAGGEPRDRRAREDRRCLCACGDEVSAESWSESERVPRAHGAPGARVVDAGHGPRALVLRTGRRVHGAAGRAALRRARSASAVLRGPHAGDVMRFHVLAFDEEAQVGAGEYAFGSEGEASADHGVAVVELEDGRIRFWREYQRKGLRGRGVPPRGRQDVAVAHRELPVKLVSFGDEQRVGVLRGRRDRRPRRAHDARSTSSAAVLRRRVSACRSPIRACGLRSSPRS